MRKSKTRSSYENILTTNENYLERLRNDACRDFADKRYPQISGLPVFEAKSEGADFGRIIECDAGPAQRSVTALCKCSYFLHESPNCRCCFHKAFEAYRSGYCERYKLTNRPYTTYMIVQT